MDSAVCSFCLCHVKTTPFQCTDAPLHPPTVQTFRCTNCTILGEKWCKACKHEYDHMQRYQRRVVVLLNSSQQDTTGEKKERRKKKGAVEVGPDEDWPTQ